jgi:hypothetical protein
MRWRRSRLAAPPATSRFDREREQLEKLIASTDNRSIAEMAKIKLRVVNFVQTTPSAAKLSDATLPDPTVEVAPVLPQPLTIADASHLIDLQRQQPSLERIREHAPHPLPEPPPPPVAGVSFFSATTSLPSAQVATFQRLLVLCLQYAAIGGIMATLAFIDTLPSLTAALILSTLFAVQLAVIGVTFMKPLLMRLALDRHVTISWQGVERDRHLYRWPEVDVLSLAISEESCDCEIQLHSGKVMLATLTCFEPSFDQWLVRLREHLATLAPATVALEKRTVPCGILAGQKRSSIAE